MTYAVISFTADPVYSFLAPIAAWSWGKLGVEPLVLAPGPIDRFEKGHLQAVIHSMPKRAMSLFECPENKEATYSQVSRLYAAAAFDFLKDDDDWLITSDADMAVFQIPHILANAFGIFGADLVPENQVPMCYLSAPVKLWKDVMETGNKTLQECLDEQLGHEEMENMRGNLWCRDQEKMHNQLIKHAPLSARFHRARPGTQFATHRVDRDDVNWRAYPIPGQLIDAHLWRPGYTEENFAKILELFMTMYPEENFDWMIEYREQFIKLI